MANHADTLAVLTALAQATRLRIVRMLIAAFPRGISAGRLAQGVGRAPPTLTFHLRLLEEAGLVRSRREAQSVIYTAVPERLTGLADGLMEGYGGERAELCQPSYPERELPSVALACCGSPSRP
jgi:ArsR family transcriptional regulator, arsenate/arsenite/antimonite-responsive transcriptional repressor